MKPDIHPEYRDIKATCSCGNVIEVGSTLAEDIHIDVCSNCHPFYTGKQKIVDSGGRVERFRKRFGSRGGPAAAAPSDAPANDDTAATGEAGADTEAQAPAEE